MYHLKVKVGDTFGIVYEKLLKDNPKKYDVLKPLRKDDTSPTVGYVFTYKYDYAYMRLLCSTTN